MPTEERGNPTLKRDLLRVVAGVAIMFLGVGATLLGWLISLDIMIGINPTGPFRIHIIMIPVAIGWGVYLAGVHVAGKSWAGIAVSVGMGTVVLLVGIAMYVRGYASDDRDFILFLFWGTWLMGLGSVSIAVGAMARSRKSHQRL